MKFWPLKLKLEVFIVRKLAGELSLNVLFKAAVHFDQLHILRMRNVGHVEIGFKRNVTHLKYLKVASRIRTQIVGVECKNPDH